MGLYTLHRELWVPRPLPVVFDFFCRAYKLWRRTHRFSELNGDALIVDAVAYALPFGLLGHLVHRLPVARDLRQIFDYRALRAHALLPQQPGRA